MKKKPFYKKYKNVLRGTKLKYNAAIQERYTKAINNLVSRMTKATTKELTRLFKGEIADDFFDKQAEIAALDEKSLFDKDFHLDELASSSKKKYQSKSIASKSRILLNALTMRYEQLFNQEVPVLVEKMLKDTEKYSKSSIQSSINKMTPDSFKLKSGLIKKNEKEVYKALIEENVNYIKSIPQEYFKNINGAVMRSISSGTGLPDLVPSIEKSLKQANGKSLKYYDESIARKAKNIGLDQTRKAYTAINKQKLLNIGVKKFEWSHSYGGMNPRKSHIKIDGHIFSFENLEKEQAALGVPEADRGLPGFPPYCRCVLGAVLNFDEEN